jgi:PTS system nitrogen regulatory IIA component
VALPHAQLGQIANPALIFARLRQSIDFGARDGEPVDLVLLVLWPADSPQGFLPALAEICRVLREPKLLRQLRGAASAEQALALLREAGSDAPGRIQARETDAR